MLVLKDIAKDYQAGDTKVEALRGIDLQFREKEFAAILGPSGCGKTTLLNIIGGLDQYSRGDLIINGRSTKQFRDSDWDTYRNHSIGFVFQSYNLIPHQTVLSNVELALTLSGVSRDERRRRAIEALEKVGLKDQLKKKPNQMSGGQMQRVAIARALVNDPDILLADEPTGALDSETSVQVMEILKEISKDKLVIMVTHNPDLADRYASRIIRLLDGRVISDSMPCEEAELKTGETGKQKKPSMSFATALSLSLTNLMTKKGRTILTAFAGSIGIIGIALILSLSAGVDMFIERIERDTLSSYPLEIDERTIDMTDMMTGMMDISSDSREHVEGKVYSGSRMTKLMSGWMSGVTENNLTDFKKYLDSRADEVNELVSGIQYEYSTPLTLYRLTDDGQAIQVNPSTTLEAAGMIERRLWSCFHSALIRDGVCYGVLIYDESTQGLEALYGDSVIIATGGQNSLFGKTTGSTQCDGYVAGKLFMQGAELKNLEFIQYHPTTIDIFQKRMLISEAVRGEGGRLFYEESGKKVYFMEEKFGAKGNLVTRDIMSRSIYETGRDVYLDISFMNKERINEKIPEVRDLCLKYRGIDISKEPIPVAPCVHFFMGGLAVHMNHETNIRSLYAIGECASMYHGANRLGGNSLLSAIYSGMVAADDISKNSKPKEDIDFSLEIEEEKEKLKQRMETRSKFPVMYIRDMLAETMNKSMGIVRTEAELDKGLSKIDYYLSIAEKLRYDNSVLAYFNYSLVGILNIAKASVFSAKARKESRGAHYRSDYPDSKDADAYASIIAYNNGDFKIRLDKEKLYES